MFKVILVASGKGGTGKTAVTAGVGAALAQAGRRVLLIDGDCGLRNLDIVLGMSDQVVFSFQDVAQGTAALSRAAAQHPDVPGLFLLTAPGAFPRLSERDMERLARAAEDDGFDYVIIDGPAGLSAEFELFSAIATQAVIVTMPDRASVRCAERAARLLESEHIMRLRLVVNRVRPQLIRNGALDNIDDAMDAVGLPLLGLVPEDEDVIACGSRGKSIHACKKAGAALAYRNIARRLEGERLPLMRI